MSLNVILENKHFCLTIGADGCSKSLYCKDTAQECLCGSAPLCAVTQSRFYNNENKLANPTQRTIMQANCVRREGNALFVGFQNAPYEAVLEVTEAENYIAVKLKEFSVPDGAFGDLNMDTPPVESFQLLQLPVKHRSNFGALLGVMWDDDTAVSILAAAPHTMIESSDVHGGRLLSAAAQEGICLEGAEAALIAAKTSAFLDAVDAFEADYNLPRGVQARRNPENRCSYYFGRTVNPGTIDEHIAYCKKCGLQHFVISYSSVFNCSLYERCGDYDESNFSEKYPNGLEDLKLVLQKILDAGLLPGLHFLHTHIGLKSSYIERKADHRLLLKRHFTLARPLGKGDTAVYVEQDPQKSPMADGCRILQFGGELIAYEGYSREERCFVGCTRGHLCTDAAEHPLGEIGGILDVSEFCAQSCHIDQETGLMDEIADKIAKIYNLGFRFVYFDGSEGTNQPFAYHVANAQWRVWQKLQPAPICSEGAAKSHFSWHMLPGGNAFDIFTPDVFKEMIRVHPAAEAERMQKDFTRVNFGWWDIFPDLQPDHWEYGCAMAAAWDCPVGIHFSRKRLKAHPRTDDLLEVVRRWEDVRIHNLLTDDEKKRIRENPMQEHILLVNEQKQYEVCAYEQIPVRDENLRAFLMERRGCHWVVYWHTTGAGEIRLPQNAEVYEELYAQPRVYTDGVAPASCRRYWKTTCSRQEIIDFLDK